MYAQQANFNISFCNYSIKFNCIMLIFAGYIHLCFNNILHGLYFFEVVFLKIIFTNSRKSAIGFTPGVFQGDYFGVFIYFGHSFCIIIKKKCSPFNQGIIQHSIMSINKDITPMTELSDPPSYCVSTNVSTAYQYSKGTLRHASYILKQT